MSTLYYVEFGPKTGRTPLSFGPFRTEADARKCIEDLRRDRNEVASRRGERDDYRIAERQR